jgi:hypothetical protein
MTTRPKIEMLRPDDVVVDQVVQRSLDKNWVDRLVENWDDAKMGVPEVSRREKGDYATDGQHRLEALKALGRGNERFAMQVTPSEGREDEAKRFISRNAENRRPHAIDIFRIQFVAGDPQVVAIQDVLAEHALHVDTGVTQRGVIACVSALRSVYRQGGSDLLDRTLTVIGDAWDGEPASWNGGIVKGVALILHKRGSEVDMVDMSRKLGVNITPNRLIGKSRTLAEAWSKSLALAVADVVLGIYNSGKRSRKIEL